MRCSFHAELQLLVERPYDAVNPLAVAPNLPDAEGVNVQDASEPPDRFSVCVANIVVA